MENRKELNFVVVNIVLLLLLVSVSVGCSKFLESDLNLKCEGKNVHTFLQDGKKTRNEFQHSINLTFKEKKEYLENEKRYVSEKCQVWSETNIQCYFEKISEEEKDNKKMRYTELTSFFINRVTGEINSTRSFSRNNDFFDEDFFTGTCTKIEGKKF